MQLKEDRGWVIEYDVQPFWPSILWRAGQRWIRPKLPLRCRLWRHRRCWWVRYYSRATSGHHRYSPPHPNSPRRANKPLPRKVSRKRLGYLGNTSRIVNNTANQQYFDLSKLLLWSEKNQCFYEKTHIDYSFGSFVMKDILNRSNF